MTALPHLALLAMLQAAPISLDGEWRFAPDPADEGSAKGWAAPSFDDSAWEKRTVPGDVGDGKDGVFWFRRTFDFNPAAAGAKPALVFRQVDDHAEVFVNGERLAISESWNTPFVVDLSGKAAGTMTVAVRVKDLGGPGGIMKSVTCETVNDISDLFKSEWSDKAPLSTLEQNGDLVIYSLFVRNFTKRGTFEAAQARLAELRRLGVNTIWLLPIHPIGKEKRKGGLGSPYAISDYYDVNPEYGTKEDFKRFVEAAHLLEMKVIIDCVLNHTSPDSVLAKEHPDWFLRDESGKPRPEVADWWDVVDLDWSKREVWDYSAAMMEHWVKEYGVDGFRCDVASMVPTGFWNDVRPRLEAAKKGDRIVMLAESDAPDLHEKAFDLTYDWQTHAAAVGIANGKLDARALRSAIMGIEKRYQKGAAHLRYVENHDSERALNTFGSPEKVKLAAALTALLPGVPLLYTGTEAGAKEKRDIFDKNLVSFEKDEHRMREYWNALLDLRREHAALRKGTFRLLEVEPADKVIAFEREYAGKKVIVTMNWSDSSVVAKFADGLTARIGKWQWTCTPK